MPSTAEISTIVEPAENQPMPAVPDNSHAFAVSLMQMLRQDLARRHEVDRESVSVLRELRDVLAGLRDELAFRREKGI